MTDFPAELLLADWIARDPEGYIEELAKAERLGYLAPSDEWLNLGEPLRESLQHVADRLANEGRIPDLRAGR